MESFVMYTSYARHIKRLSQVQKGNLFDAILLYATDGTVLDLDDVTGIAFDFIREDIDRNAKKYAEIVEKKRAAGKARADKYKELQMQADANRCKQMQADANGCQHSDNVNGSDNVNVNVNVNENANDSESESDNDICAQKRTRNRKEDVRHRYGMYQNVLLTDSDLEKWKVESPADWDDRIDRLSEYIKSHGKGYSDYLATLRAWKRKDEQISVENGKAAKKPNMMLETAFEREQRNKKQHMNMIQQWLSEEDDDDET